MDEETGWDRFDCRGSVDWREGDSFGERAADKELVQAIEHAVRNVRRVAQQQLPKAWSIETDRGVRISQRVEPIERIGCYIPGGSFALVSTLIMTVVPAQVAGVKEIVVACPRPNGALLAAAEILGVKRIARIGGAQAIAAMAYGNKERAARGKNFRAREPVCDGGETDGVERLCD